MDVFLVGGAVRDRLLGRPVTERDWVVVGSSPSDLLDAGYKQVGRDFPVFLHPDTGEEYALARTERKTGPGHRGFRVHADPDVTLKQDLLRRDLSVNAIAEDSDGNIIDPFGGQRDLENRLLRHLSPAFAEDPLRVFRVARFAAVLDGFTVAPETVALMRRMSEAGALSELPGERVWRELARALMAAAPDRFFEVLADARALGPWLVELDGVHIPPLARLETLSQRYALLVSPLLPAAAQARGGRLKVPSAHQKLARWTLRWRSTVAGWRAANPLDVHRALADASAFKHDKDLLPGLKVLGVLEARGMDDLKALADLLRTRVRATDLQEQGLSGKALGDALVEARVDLIRESQASGQPSGEGP